MPEQHVLTILNRHAASCGAPPDLTNADRSRYYGYFQNEHGDQWVFVDDPATETATLRTGDAQWSTIYTIRGIEDLPYHLNDVERAWAQACWQAASMTMAARKRTADAHAGT